MFSADQIESLNRLPGAILTVYLNTQLEDSARHLPLAPSLAWLRKEAQSIGEKLKDGERHQFETQWSRLETFLAGRHPHEKALAIFAGPGTWELVPLPVAVENDLRWGAPEISQLLRLTEEHKAYCVVVVDKKEARLLRFQFAEAVTIAERSFSVDVSQWKTKEMGHVTGQGVRKTRGSHRDDFDHRVEAQYARLCRETAQQAAIICQREKLAGIFLVGSSHLVDPIAADIPPEFLEPLGFFREDLGGIPVEALGRRLAAPIRDWERQYTETLVQKLLDAPHGTVTEPDEVLAQLQQGAISRVVVASGLALDLRECDRCGWADRSADPVCSKCGASRHTVTLKDVLPRLARKYKVQLYVVDAAATEQLRKIGGIGGWHRDARRAVA